MSRPVSPPALATGLLLGFALACSLGGDSFEYSRGKPTGPDATNIAGLDRAYRVPPDRAILLVGATVTADTPSVASSLLTDEVTALRQAVGDRCTVTVLDYSAPVGGYSTSQAGARVRLDVELKGLTDIEARRARIDACEQALAPRLTSDWGKVAQGQRAVTAAAPVLVVDDPDAHRDALLARERGRLGWAAAAGGVPQLHPEDLRCVPDGRVVEGDRQLSGITLELGMNCRVEGTAVGAVAANP